MSHTVWKGYLAFGLVSIPVRLSAAARSESIALHMLCARCQSRLNQKLYCPGCQKEISRGETLKGYEATKHCYVVLTPAEIEAIAPPSSRVVEILCFVRRDEVDPLYFESSYYLEPEKIGRPAYKLLAQAMQATGRSAIARIAMHQREHAVLIRPRGAGLALHTLYSESEVRQHELTLAEVEVASDVLELARQLIASLSQPFDPGLFRDGYQARLLALIESKRRGQPLAIAAPAAAARVVDITEALARSLERNAPPPDAAPAAAPVRDEAAASAPTQAPPRLPLSGPATDANAAAAPAAPARARRKPPVSIDKPKGGRAKNARAVTEDTAS